MKTINKKYIIEYISNLIITHLKKSPSVNYNIIKKDIINNNKLALYLSKRKNKHIYLENILKIDKQLRYYLNNNNIYYTNNTFKIGKSEKKEKKTFSNPNLTNLNCPYDTLISNSTKKKLNTFSKTNEKVLNYKLNRNLFFQSFIKTIDDITKKLRFFQDRKCIKVLINDSYFFSLNNNKYHYYKSKEFQKYISTISKIYPFNYFNYNNVILMSYILIKLNKYNESKYITILLFDNIIDRLKLKYFNNMQSMNRRIYDVFFSDKINQMKLVDYTLINNYYKICKNDFNFVSFSIGLYKLIIYLKNKYNREIKHISIELYDSDRDITNMVSIDDERINSI